MNYSTFRGFFLFLCVLIGFCSVYLNNAGDGREISPTHESGYGREIASNPENAPFAEETHDPAHTQSGTGALSIRLTYNDLFQIDGHMTLINSAHGLPYESPGGLAGVADYVTTRWARTDRPF